MSNYPGEFPMIRIELEGMKQSIIHAFMDRQLSMSAEVQRALDLECAPEKLQAYVDSAAREAVETATKNAVSQWWATSEIGQKLIREAVAKRMEKEAEFWSSK